jgi:hypothetical protein
MEDARIETRYAADATLFLKDSFPEILSTGSDASDRTNPGDDRASSRPALDSH